MREEEKNKRWKKDERQLLIWMVNDTGSAIHHSIIVQAGCHPQSKHPNQNGHRLLAVGHPPKRFNGHFLVVHRP